MWFLVYILFELVSFVEFVIGVCDLVECGEYFGIFWVLCNFFRVVIINLKVVVFIDVVGIEVDILFVVGIIINVLFMFGD